MTQFKKQLFSVITAGTLVLNTAGTALAGTTIEISGNGAGSDNGVVVNQSSSNTVTQNNNAVVTNTVDSDANTGNNSAGFNTGGDVVIGTGDATTNVTVSNDLNKNVANTDCCNAGNTDVLVSGNGAWTDNAVDLTNKNTTKVTQNNYAKVNNDVDTDADTGNNSAYKNTGGDVLIGTGNAKTNVTLNTSANVNVASVGPSASVTPTASFRILGNGAGSDNIIKATLARTTVLDQENDAYVTNDVDADADTGDNDAGFNTGGEVFIGTGDATTNVDVDNAVNFNFADADCGCEYDVVAKIAGNGANAEPCVPSVFSFLGGCYELDNEFDNYITLNLGDSKTVLQDNLARLTNDLEYQNADTGDNSASSNTGAVDYNSDPAIGTGDATSNVSVSNTGNENVSGASDFDFDMPWGNTNVGFSFNMAALWAVLGLSM